LQKPDVQYNSTMLKTAGIILCGGQSRRMGRAKAWLPFGDELMLPRVVRILGTVAQPLVVVAAPTQEVPPLPPSVAIVRDSQPGRGPLEGLSAGLAALRNTRKATFLTSCDAPFLQPAFVTRMAELLGKHMICVPRVGGFFHPMAAVYRVEVYDAIQRLLAAGRLRPVFLFEELATRIVEAHELADIDPALQSLRNLNSPEDYEAALHEAGFKRAETGDQDRGG
jgi:molybdenum cofactor guanylyltransferase